MFAVKHGMHGTPEYRAWRHAIGRCYDPNDRAWANYGGRGIRMCEQWRNDFAAFFAHIGAKPSAAHTLDRWPNNDGHYEPGNVRWATRAEQSQNRREFKRRAACLRGHPFTAENTYLVARAGKQYQSCRKCRRMAEAKRGPR